MKKQKPLALSGSGVIGNLISTASEEDLSNETAVWIPIDKIRPGPFQQRQYFSQEGLEDLAKSFKKQGFHGAIIVRSSPGGFYEIIAGERRWRAASIAGLDAILCIVHQFTDIEALKFGLAENLLREDLSKLEETEGILKLIEVEFRIPRDQAIEVIRTEGHPEKKNRRNVSPSEQLGNIESILSTYGIDLQTFRTKHLRTLILPDELKAAHLKHGLAYTTALELNKIKNKDERTQLLTRVLDEKLSFREVKQRVKEVLRSRAPKDMQSEEELLDRLSTVMRLAKVSKHMFSDKKSRNKLEKLLEQLEALLNAK